MKFEMDFMDGLVQVTVETLEKGFLINVFSAKSSQGMLVSILEAIEEMRLTVLEARVSCTDNFCFQAVGEEVRYIHIVINKRKLYVQENNYLIV